MKNQIILLFVVALLLGGCVASQPPESQSDQLELLSMTSLPPVSSMYVMGGIRLKMLFHVKGNGSVSEVKMMGSTGDADWDHAAMDSMKLWQFSPFQSDNAAAERWIRNTIIVQVQEPTVLTLGELKVEGKALADSLYLLLSNGSDFEVFTKQLTPGTTETMGRYIGAVDIARYPKHVRDALSRLQINQMTPPLRVGGKYVIYKRYRPDGVQEDSE